MRSDPYHELSLEQLEQVVEEQARIQGMRGVIYADMEYLGGGIATPALVVHLYSASAALFACLPESVGDVPVVVKIGA